MINKSPPTSLWFQYWRHQPNVRIRLFCFPYAGGGASIFRTWVEYIPPHIELCPIQLPGRENRLAEQAYSQLPALIDALAQRLIPYLDMPYAFFGHSMGALIAFELARYLRRVGQGPGPVHLFVSGHRAPQLPDADAPTYHLPETDFIAELRRLNGTPEEVLRNAELLHLLIPLLRADFEVCETYHYQQESPLSCPLSAFGGLQDVEIGRNAIVAWQEQTSKKFKARFFMGNHFYLHKEHFSLVQALTQDLASSFH